MHDLSGGFIALGVAVLKVIVAFTAGIFAVTLGLKLFGRWSKGIDEIQELKRNNLAVGILLAAVVLAYTLVIGTGLQQLTDGVVGGSRPWQERLMYFVGGLINVAIAVTVASLTVRYALLAFQRFAKDINQDAELRNRNIAVAILLAGIIYGISQVTSRGLDEIGQGVGTLLTGIFT